MERECIKCGQIMIPVKNGFYTVHNNIFRSSDLWGCLPCRRFQIHGMPEGFEVTIIEGGELQPDPGSDTFLSILDPVMTLPSYFSSHMKEFYPEWRWEDKDESK